MKTRISCSLFLLFFCVIGLTACELTVTPPVEVIPCNTDSQCFSDEICAVNSCEPIYPGFVGLHFDWATIDYSDPNGFAWDDTMELFEAPDPRIIVEVDGDVVFESTEIYDTYDPVWDESVLLYLEPESQVSIYVVDEDIFSAEIIWEKHFPAPFCTDCVRDGSFVATPTSTMLDFGFGISLE